MGRWRNSLIQFVMMVLLILLASPAVEARMTWFGMGCGTGADRCGGSSGGCCSGYDCTVEGICVKKDKPKPTAPTAGGGTSAIGGGPTVFEQQPLAASGCQSTGCPEGQSCVPVTTTDNTGKVTGTKWVCCSPDDALCGTEGPKSTVHGALQHTDSEAVPIGTAQADPAVIRQGLAAILNELRKERTPQQIELLNDPANRHTLTIFVGGKKDIDVESCLCVLEDVVDRHGDPFDPGKFQVCRCDPKGCGTCSP